MTETDRDAVEKMLIRIEAGVHRHGWDEPPVIAALALDPRRGLQFTPVPLRLDNPLGEYVAAYGDMFTLDQRYPEAFSCPPDAARFTGAFTFFGFGLVSEGYAQRGPAQELKKLAASGKDIADVPGSVEIRMIAAVDVNANSYFIERIRGEKPFGTGPDEALTGGRIYLGLTKMTLSVVRLMPDYQDNIGALEELVRTAEAQTPAPANE